jgi:membrane associated rhomboid family serine protease
MLTSAFLHFGILHIGFNMWVLWQLGALVERLTGNIGFLVLYLLSALGGSLASLLWNPLVISAGASGAVFGVCGGLLGFIVLRGDSIPLGILKQLRGSMLSFLGYNLVFGLMVSGIDIACHLGGLISGFVCGLMLSQPLGPAMVARRWKRNLVCVVVALLLLTLGMAALPASPAQELQEIDQGETEIINRYDSQLKRNREHPLPDAEWADELDREILKPWQQICAKVGAVSHSRLVDQAVMKKYEAYFDLRERSWSTLVAGLRTQDPAKIEEFGKLWHEANQTAAQLSHH